MLEKETRTKLVHIFSELQNKKLTEIVELKAQICECGRDPGDPCDDADNTIHHNFVCVRIDTINNDLLRIELVLKKLNNGWDATCIDCEESILERLLAGNPTRRCCHCRTALEVRNSMRHSRAALY